MSREATKVLTKSRFAVLNLLMIQLAGRDAACLFGALVYKCPNQTGDEFELDTDKIQRMLKMSTFLRLKAEETLVSLGLITKATKGWPPTNWYALDLKRADDMLDGMLPKVPNKKGIASTHSMKNIDSLDEVHRASQRSTSTHSTKESAVTPNESTTSEESAAIKKKEKNNTKKNIYPTPPSGESDSHQRYHGKRSGAGKEKIAHIQSTAVASSSASVSGGGGTGLDPAVPMGSPAAESRVGEAIAGGGDSAPAADGSALKSDPTLKKDGTPRADAAEMKFLAFYIAEYERIHGTKPILGPHGRTTIVIRNILTKMDGRKAELVRIVRRFLSNEDPFYTQTGWSLLTLAMDNTLNAHSDVVWKARMAAKGKLILHSQPIGRKLDDPSQ